MKLHNRTHRECPFVLIKYSPSLTQNFIFLGRFHPSTKELKNPLIHPHPSLPRRPEAIGSGSRWRTMSPNVSIVWLLSPLIVYFLSHRSANPRSDLHYGHFNCGYDTTICILLSNLFVASRYLFITSNAANVISLAHPGLFEHSNPSR